MATAVEKPKIYDFHYQRFDTHRQKAHEFARDNLGLTHIIGLGRLAIIHEADAPGVAAQLNRPLWGRGEYDPRTMVAVVTAEPDVNNPVGASQALVSGAVHEYVHSGTFDKEETGEHTFWLEGLAGMGEALYLQDLTAKGTRAAAGDGVLRRAGVELWIPGSFRYYDNHDTRTANSSQGLMAASAFAAARLQSGIGARDVLAASAPTDRTHVKLMKTSFDRMKPGLSKEIETFPQTTEGIIQATAAVHDEARKQRILPPLRR
jgi:hypothetical protein